MEEAPGQARPAQVIDLGALLRAPRLPMDCERCGRALVLSPGGTYGPGEEAPGALLHFPARTVAVCHRCQSIAMYEQLVRKPVPDELWQEPNEPKGA